MINLDDMFGSTQIIRTELPNYCYLCFDHFKDNSFHKSQDMKLPEGSKIERKLNLDTTPTTTFNCHMQRINKQDEVIKQLDKVLEIKSSLKIVVSSFLF